MSALALGGMALPAVLILGIDGNLTTAVSVTVVENTVTTAIDDLDELGDLDF